MVFYIAGILGRGWQLLPEPWRRRVLLVALISLSFQAVRLAFGQDMLVLCLVAGFSAAFIFASLRLSKACVAELWFYRKVAEQIETPLTGAMVPVVTGVWANYLSSRTSEALAGAVATTMGLACLLFLMRRVLAVTFEEQVQQRRHRVSAGPA